MLFWSWPGYVGSMSLAQLLCHVSYRRMFQQTIARREKITPGQSEGAFSGHASGAIYAYMTNITHKMIDVSRAKYKC